jgi:hypothetical protein
MMTPDNETLKFLLYVRDVLQKHNVSFFLDCGTLLGAIRDKKFIPWDSDVDLGAIGVVAGDDVSFALMREFRHSGCTVLVSCTAISIRRTGSLDVNIKLYHREEDEFVARYIRRSHRYNIVRFLADVRNGNHVYSVGPGLSIMLKRAVCAIRPILRFLPFGIIENQIHEQVKANSFPVDFFLNTEEILFYGQSFPVPKDSETYLALRYGDNWKMPVRDYNWFEDDQSLNDAI